VQTAWSCTPGWAHEHVACTHWLGSATIASQMPFESAGHQGSHHCYILPWVGRLPVLYCTTCLARSAAHLRTALHVSLPVDQLVWVPCREGGQRRDTGCHLLAEQGAAPALDHVQRRVHLVRAVYRHVELRLLIQRRQRDAQPCDRLLGSARAPRTACLPAARFGLHTPCIWQQCHSSHSHALLQETAAVLVATGLVAACIEVLTSLPDTKCLHLAHAVL
jgi:hypothetical protein